MQGSEDLCDSGFPSVGCDKDVFDIFGFWRGKLFLEVNKRVAAQVDESSRLDLRPPFD